jgi:hypothetical protein
VPLLLPLVPVPLLGALLGLLLGGAGAGSVAVNSSCAGAARFAPSTAETVSVAVPL